jgi:hypothetical protein
MRYYPKLRKRNYTKWGNSKLLKEYDNLNSDISYYKIAKNTDCECGCYDSRGLDRRTHEKQKEEIKKIRLEILNRMK